MKQPFDAAGALLDAYRRVDWAATSLGAPESWGPALRGALDLILNTRSPSTLFWGPEYVMLYNEAYVAMIGDKHPAALGARTAEVFPEIWDTIGPMLDGVFAGHGATWAEDLRLPLVRRGFPEETYFTFSYSAVRGAAGAVEGAIDIAWETTGQIIGNRRLALLSRLNDSVAGSDDVRGLVERALPVLRSVPDDLPEVEVVAPGVHPVPGGPAGDVVLERTAGGAVAWIRLSDRAMLRCRLSAHLPVDAAYLGFLRLIGSALQQGIVRGRALQAERRAADLERGLAEALQRSLLVPPAQPEHLQVAVRYQPASDGARIGGDWYDSFLLRDGRLVVVIGDVTGHDRIAAATMSQVRNLLRGIAHAAPRPPDALLAVLDDAMTGSRMDLLATAVVAEIELAGPGGHEVRWSNAGHPPPVLLGPDGSARLLRAGSETLLGTRTPVRRTSHALFLEPGASLVFYTDGLIERRDTSVEQGFHDLLEHLRGRAGDDAEELAEHIMGHFAVGTEDDVALAVVRLPPSP